MKKICFVLLFFAVTSLLITDLYSQEINQKGDKLVVKRYLVERTFPEGLNIPVNVQGSEICLTVVSTNIEDNVTWIHSYVTKDKKKTFCIYDAPSQDAIRKAAKNNGLPVDNIIEVSVLDPYFYQ